MLFRKKHKGCSLPNPHLVQRMLPFTPSQTDKAISARFGISYATWRKLIEGRPVRSSLMERLEKRIRVLEHGASGRGPYSAQTHAEQ